MQPNDTGRCPDHLVGTGKKVRVKLRNGSVEANWPADGKGAMRWSLTGSPFDVVEWELML